MKRTIQNTACLTIFLVLGCHASAALASISVNYSKAEGAIHNQPFTLTNETVAGSATAGATAVYGGFSSTATAQFSESGYTTRLTALFEQTRVGLLDNFSRGTIQIAFTPSEDVYFNLSGGIYNTLGYTQLSSVLSDSLADDDNLNQYGAQGNVAFSVGNVNLWGYGTMHGLLRAGRTYVWSVEALTDAELGFSADAALQSSSMSLVIEPVVMPAVASVPEPSSLAIWLLLAIASCAALLRRRFRRA